MSSTMTSLSAAAMVSSQQQQQQIDPLSPAAAYSDNDGMMIPSTSTQLETSPPSADQNGGDGGSGVVEDDEEDSDNDGDNDNGEDDEDDDITVIVLEHGDDDDEGMGAGWVDQDSPEMRERRRNVLLRELQRVQRASFIHFMILCLIPTSLLVIVIATVLGEDEDCESAATTCEKEARTFINAFTTRCICDAITVARVTEP